MRSATSRRNAYDGKSTSALRPGGASSRDQLGDAAVVAGALAVRGVDLVDRDDEPVLRRERRRQRQRVGAVGVEAEQVAVELERLERRRHRHAAGASVEHGADEARGVEAVEAERLVAGAAVRSASGTSSSPPSSSEVDEAGEREQHVDDRVLGEPQLDVALEGEVRRDQGVEGEAQGGERRQRRARCGRRRRLAFERLGDLAADQRLELAEDVVEVAAHLLAVARRAGSRASLHALARQPRRVVLAGAVDQVVRLVDDQEGVLEAGLARRGRTARSPGRRRSCSRRPRRCTWRMQLERHLERAHLGGAARRRRRGRGRGAARTASSAGTTPRCGELERRSRGRSAQNSSWQITSLLAHIRALARSWIERQPPRFMRSSVSTASFCCSVLAVRKTTRRPVSSASLTAGYSAAAVLPTPVGAASSRWRPLRASLATASIASCLDRAAARRTGTGGRPPAARQRSRERLALALGRDQGVQPTAQVGVDLRPATRRPARRGRPRRRGRRAAAAPRASPSGNRK